jgi:outer membrane protein
MTMNYKFMVLVMLCSMTRVAYAQQLSLPEALERSVKNYQKIRSKEALWAASVQNTAFQKSQYLPDVIVVAQQSFGTINAQNGPLYGYGGLGIASTSMPLADQNWNAAFGSLYLANVNWNLFSFGRIKKQVGVARAREVTAVSDLAQEIFQHQVKVSAAYLNLLASQRIKYVQEKNLDRAAVFYSTTESRAQSGLIPEVDAALAKAEVSNAQSARITAYDMELEYARNLAVLMGDEFRTYELDSLFTTTIPVPVTGNAIYPGRHPSLLWQKSKIDHSIQQEHLIQAQKLPSLSAFGVLQGRGSGFDWNYVQDNRAYSSSYLDGAGIDRGNYIVGLTLSWNLSHIYRHHHKKKEQQLVTTSLQHDYRLLQEELKAQTQLASAKLRNAFENFEETKIQLEAAQLAYKQHTALYDNGLTTVVDYTQSLYTLSRAETSYEIAQNNAWQALLLQAAAQGDLSILFNAIQK